MNDPPVQLPQTEQSGHGRPSQPARVREYWAFTLIELLVTVAIIAILALIAVPPVQQARTRSKVALSKNNIRLLTEAVELYRLDFGAYPQALAGSSDDPYGVIATSALRSLTTPVAYATADTLRDPFGFMRLQSPVSSALAPADADPFRPPAPGFNPRQSMLYFYYPRLAWLMGDAGLKCESCAVVGVGPDLKDSFIVYYPFPASLPSSAIRFGINRIEDTIYDPTNGILSGGDLAGFSAGINKPRIVGGGDR